MNGWSIGMLCVIAYLAMNNVGHHLRWKKLVKSMSALSGVIGEMSSLPEGRKAEGQKAWEEANIKASEAGMASTVIFVVIIVFLVVFGFKGHF